MLTPSVGIGGIPPHRAPPEHSLVRRVGSLNGRRHAMSISLHLALDVLDTVEEALENGERIDPEAEADRLLEAHPEAEVDKRLVVDLLRSEQAAAECALL
jgi:hypothetical protein